MDRVLIYRSALLPISETFVLGHCAGLKRYEPKLVGMNYVPGGFGKESLPPHATLSPSTAAPWEVAARKILLRRKFLEQQLAAFRPNVIHAHFAANALDVMSVASRHALPLVVTIHGSEVTQPMTTHMKTMSGCRYLVGRGSLWGTASAFLAASRFIADCMLSAGFPARKVRHHYLGIEIPPREVQREAIRKSRRPTVLFVGRLIEQKGIMDLLSALAKLSHLKDLRCEVIGDGEMAGPARRFVQEAGLDVTFLGAQPHSVVVERMKQANVFCMPARNEGLGLVYIEAQAYGLPVVAYDTRPLDEAIAPGGSGILAPVGDTGALARGIEGLVRDQQAAHEMGVNGRAFVERHFDRRVQSALLESIYDDVR